jgi:DNA-binding NtrC family response regulator
VAVSREVIATRAADPAEDLSQGDVLTALVASGPGDAWLLPDDPFVNAGCRILRAASQAEIIALCDRHAPNLVFLPLVVAGEASLASLKHCLAMRPAPVVVVVAANDQINAAAEAMRAGAFDCLFKPFSTARLGKTIEAALRTVPRLAEAGLVADNRPGVRAGAGGSVADPAEAAAARQAGLIGGSREMRAVVDKISAIAPAPAPVFVTGEVGTGKSLVAQLVHERSPRAGRPFVRLDCAGLDAARLEDELFGAGGAAGSAEGGTLFLDEICEVGPAVQPRLLRLIEAHAANGGGAGRSGLRLVAATRHDPRAAIREGRLRADLYYRLHVAPIHLPPLRSRPGDVAVIARVKLREFAEAEGRIFTGFSDGALELLTAYSWPGNVRELLNVLWTLVLMNPGPLITPDLLPPEITQGGDGERPAPEPLAEPDGGDELVGHTLAEIERRVIEATIRNQGGSVPRAARVLDVSPSTLYRKREAWEKQDKF